MEPFRDDNDLIAELSALRPAPRSAFAAGLDERAAAGFPRRSSRTASPLDRLFSRLATLSARRLVLAGGATALAAVAAATLVVGNDEPGAPSHLMAPLRASERPASTPTEGASDSGSGGTGSTGAAVEYSASAGTGPYAAQAGHRDVERSAEMVLGADPDEVAGAAAQVFDAVHAANGIVLSSSVTGGAAGDAGARFDLLVPATKLSDALADFSAIGTVVSRHEATDDITAPTVRIGEQLRDSRATIDGLLVQLAGADSDEERAEVEAELRAERHHAAALRSQASKLDRRANLSRVSLRIETGGSPAAEDSGGGWDVGDALHDAGHILRLAAAVAILGLAILAPLALIALLIWLINRTRIRRARERALG
jgi:hypothetical protein